MRRYICGLLLLMTVAAFGRTGGRDTIITVKLDLVKPDSSAMVDIYTQRMDDKPGKNEMLVPGVSRDVQFRFNDTLVTVFHEGERYVVKTVLPPKSIVNGVVSFSGEEKGVGFFTIVYPVSKIPPGGRNDLPGIDKAKITIYFGGKVKFTSGDLVKRTVPPPQQKREKIGGSGTQLKKKF